MLLQSPQEVERKVISILKVLSQSDEPLGARIVSHQLQEYGIQLSERAVRYHLKIMDERGFTQSAGRDGRLITQAGIEELQSALVSDKIGLIASRIEFLAYQTKFDIDKRKGIVPMNISLFPEDKFNQAIMAMKPVFQAGLCVSDLVSIAHQGESLGGITIPQGKTGFASVCSIIVNGVLAKRGIPIYSKFAGILQFKDYKPIRFINLIYYSGSSLDPSEIFIASKMTSAGKVAKDGEGKVLASFREIPSFCHDEVEEIAARFNNIGIKGPIIIGETSKPVCETPVETNRSGMIFTSGLNPVAAAVESGIDVENYAMHAVMKYQSLVKFDEL
ncbi:MAG: DUF128 domain-containing protein [Dehalococcoidia bacterium]|nr:DUF128 domain-containing protein [Dehalococcoidia bacterium]